MILFDFKKVFGNDRLGTEKEGEEDFKKIEKLVLDSKFDENIVFDISSMSVFSHSYAKQTIGLMYDKLFNGKYGNRHFFILNDKIEKQSKTQVKKISLRGKLGDLEKAMEKVNLPALVSEERISERFYKNYMIIGSLQNNLNKVLEIIIENKEVTTSYVSQLLGETLQSASTKLARLESYRLIEKTIPIERSGNFFTYKRLEIR